MKRINLLLLFCCITLSLAAQWKWNDPLQASFPVIQNQGWTTEIGKTYTRLPESAKRKVPEAVWNLSRHSSGLAIHFYTNAPEIKIRYAVTGSLAMSHMPATSVSGLDLYSINSDGEWNFCSGDFVFGDTIVYHYNRIKKDKYHNYGYEYRLYLPLYNGVKWMEIGTPDQASFEFIPVSAEKPVVLYGTSIVQGACASRPAMAWSSILERSLGYPLINMGFSGNTKMEKEVIDYLTGIDARLYVLDCIPNMFEYEGKEIAKRIVEAVRQIREKSKAPVLLIEHAGNSNAQTDTMRYSSVANANEASLYAYRLLQSEGVGDIHYLFSDELNIPADGWLDYVHLNDLGMQAQALAVEQNIRKILKIPEGDGTTMKPVTQRREPHNYEWRKRHQEVLSLNKSNPSTAVIMGNSITHFWGGEPLGPRQDGAESWNTYMKPLGFRNLGYGWDRIENVLWRVYHDELDGFDAERIILMIGTNNWGLSSDDQIVDGLNFLLKAIRERQPKASIKVIGILPRRNLEQWVNSINQRIEEMVIKEGFKFQNAGNVLLDANGKIDESLFSDGLHPNEKGYELLSFFIIE
ncbi:lysophospholipase L1-like esterase [Parabacteroides sp. PF5-5]|uniref:SGNH/GDSL hydrolase family protein n=1 Tax=unclassified Parabacteroides TaxID=2649774 RepID=UPI002474729C|nr:MULTISPECIES: SGNH/GDSL hydrolase family protein [unclassified Parabacteroides]MDH6306917.1 lysophospholipase L1-like esterase [Parabacteroides sp. PH5-39]MDH6317823.1 lysophospholipase L1-like esterase [Parabacteroides sp. PF5-13]MDH6321522.1 lysophospholipase L1-like esterase [Parabacteroides sp. PH5-13]MDH6325304.1 lysophospholipase L1-like esterase [Parabacteroides sp. PH5-8]MDH6328975.1 lysophospholipase L1-like esterase [Parabacteroides sp. PH5-41]